MMMMLTENTRNLELEVSLAKSQVGWKVEEKAEITQMTGA
jgi:hypothetical protein